MSAHAGWGIVDRANLADATEYAKRTSSWPRWTILESPVTISSKIDIEVLQGAVATIRDYARLF
jgi:hypothetical protein